MELLEIRARLAGPVALTSPLNIDGILTGAAASVQNLPQPTRLQPLPKMPDIPLAARGMNADKCFLSSDAIFINPETETGNMVRRRDVSDVEWAGKKFHKAAGAAKDKIKRFQMVAAKEAKWFAFGLIQEIEILLRQVDSIGSYRGHGYGEVSGWKISPIKLSFPKPGHAVFDECGKALRALPASWFVGLHQGSAALPCRPPYWHSDNIVDCLPPGNRGILKDEIKDGLFGNAD